MNGKISTFNYTGLAVLFTMFLGSPSLAVTTSFTDETQKLYLPLAIENYPHPELIISQQPNNTNSESKKLLDQALEIFNEAIKLQDQGTKESLEKALQKYQELLQIGKKVKSLEVEYYAIYGMGSIYADQKDTPKAIEYLTKSLEIIDKLPKPLPLQKAYIFNSLGAIYSDLWEKQKALDYYNQALAIFRTEKQPEFEAKILFFIGVTYSDLGNTQKTLEFFEQSLTLHKAIKDEQTAVQILARISAVYHSLGDKDKAIDYLNQALEIQKNNKNIKGQIEILNTLGNHYSSEQPQKSIEFYNQSLALQKQLPNEDTDTKSLTLMGLGSAYLFSGNFQQSLNYLQESRKILQTAKLYASEIKVLSMIADVYSFQGDIKTALEYLKAAQKLNTVVKDLTAEADIILDIGNLYKDQSDYQIAIDNYFQSLEIQKKIKDLPAQAVTLNKVADVYKLLGDYQLSIDNYNQALQIFNQTRDNRNILLTLNNIGLVYDTLKKYPQALEYYQQAFNLAEKTKEIQSQYLTLIGMVRTYHAMKDYPNALVKAEQALSLAKSNNSYYEATFLGYKAMVYQSMGKSQEALPLARQAVEITEKLNIIPAKPNAFYDLGNAYKALKNYPDAIAAYQKELALREKISDRNGVADTLYRIAQTEREKGDLEAARKRIEAAIEIVENIRTKVTSQDLRTSYFAKFQKYYQFYIDLLMEAHKQQPSKGYNILALQASERSRARSLLEILTETNADIRTGVDPQLLTQERNLQEKLAANEKLLIEIANRPNSNEQQEKIRTETKNILLEYRQIQAKIRSTSPRYASLTQPQTLTLTEIQKQVLDENTLLLEYALGEEKSYLWLVSKTEIYSYELPKGAEIEKIVKDFRNEITKPSSSKQNVAQNAQQLTKILLDPIADKLGNKRLVIVGDGALQYLPFPALNTPNSKEYQPLIVNHEIITLPSASTIAILRKEQQTKQTAPKTLALLADPVFSKNDERLQSKKELPDPQHNNISELALKRAAQNTDINFDRLPFTRQEAETILKLVPDNQKIQAYDFAASRDFVISQKLNQYQILHFATHGIMNSEQPELSGIVLSLFDQQGKPQNGFLRLHDIFNLDLSAELVVLSACQTGLGQDIKGEGLVGLTRGFMYAGSPRVVVSLWNVNDQATSLLMQKFYQKMLKDGLKPAAALRQAQIEMWQDEKFYKADFWAAFTLQGEWK